MIKNGKLVTNHNRGVTLVCHKSKKIHQYITLYMSVTVSKPSAMSALVFLFILLIHCCRFAQPKRLLNRRHFPEANMNVVSIFDTVNISVNLFFPRSNLLLSLLH